MSEPSDYSIVVKRVMVDGERLYAGAVLELPDVCTYGATPDGAYELALDAVAGLQELAAEMGHSFPPPREAPEAEFSGRVTLRMPKFLHRDLSNTANAEGVSLNQYIVSILAVASGRESQGSPTVWVTSQFLPAAGPSIAYPFITTGDAAMAGSTVQFDLAPSGDWEAILSDASHGPEDVTPPNMVTEAEVAWGHG